MRILLFIITFIFASNIYSQQKIIDKVTSEICDSLKNINKPLDSLTKRQSRDIINSVLIANYSDWVKEINEFERKTGQDEYDFDRYFQHILQIDCKEFRTIYKKLDTYLANKKDEQALYINTKEFIIALEDNLHNDSLVHFLNDSLNNKETNKLLKTCKKEIGKYKRTTTLSIIRLGNKFRVRYFNYLTDKAVFQIDIIYKKESDLLIDRMEIKNKSLLKKELKELMEFNRKIESGELPPPPPPPASNKKE